ncbi:MAG: hypothetical protein IKH16_08200 [Selenomonadaceae bacterium]|nr:hypothetical protein [Selenomonadaceae bacterium]
MRYRFIDGFEFEADTPEEICTAIWKSMKFGFRSNLQEWMESNAKVMGEALGRKLRTDTPEHHVVDMLKSGILWNI